ncbi:MAG TPA: hypothetical protein VK791_03245 [bacterium]|jgi:hypothetical protein|nr:hypothetical protein [bacterium]
MTKKIFFNLLFLLLLFWFVLWVWSIAFGTRPWLNSFGAMAFVVTGLFLGMIYFFSFYQCYKQAREVARDSKRLLAYVALVLVLVFVSHWLIRGVLWVGNWMGNSYGIAFWFFVGFVISGFVLYSKDRLFSKVKELFA